MMALRFGFVWVFLWDLTLAPLPSNEEWDPPWLGNSSHSLRYFYTGVSEPDQGLPQFILVGYVDGQVFVQYDSNSKEVQPRADWIKKVEEEAPEYFDMNTYNARNAEDAFRKNLAILGKRYNQSRRFHFLQRMDGCELRKDGSKGGYSQFAYDGRDYLSFDMETPAWVATDPMAQITQRKLEKEPTIAQRHKTFMEEICIAWLRRYLVYGKERLLRTVPPVGKVTHMYLPGGRERLVCQAYGFYPKEIDTNWKKGEEIMEEDTGRRTIAPNSDRTFHDWLSIEIDPEDRDLYRCHIDHDGLKEPLVLAWEVPGVSADVWPIVGIVAGVVAALIVAAIGIVFFLWRRRKKSACNAAPRRRRKKSARNAAPTSDTSSDSSVPASNKSSDSSLLA